MTDATGDAREARLRDAVAAADVGADVCFASLVDLDALELVQDGGVVRATVTVPVPSAEDRATLERDLRDALGGVAGVDDVSVAFHPSVPPAVQRVDMLPEVEHVVAVASGKGGVGKSTVAANLAVSLADAGASVGLLDADVYGPNAPSLLGLDDATPQTTRDATIVPREAHGVRVMSMDFVVGEDDPIIWRGPMVDDVLKQLTGDVEWGSLDYLVVDMPPGTGDAQLTLVQHLSVAGTVVVTTPQEVAVDDARRGLEGFAKYDVPILGVVENMRGFRCPDCDHVEDVFGAGGADALADEFDIPVLGRLPLDPAVGTLSDDDPGHGVELPVVGRVGLPRTKAEREGRLPPIALRDAGEATQAIRQTATRVAARVHAAAVRDWATEH
jgi:ATP-binding protein involved in chromosome partitioning